MTRTAGEVLEATAARLAPGPGANPLLPLIASGAAGLDTLAALAMEQRLVIAADLLSFRHLAVRSAAGEPASAPFFEMLAEGEAVAAGRLGALAEACGVDEKRAAAYEPLPGCQAYPSYVARLALGAAPADVVLALSANFASWGGYCATIARALRDRYGFTDEACGFFDFFAEPAPELAERARAALQAALDADRIDEDVADGHGRLLESYESMFWTTLARL
ncbi:transcriptional regulator [Streptomyces griseiscabiei]|uniref:Transcriptional regulator n=1 Tax=Streptomyces griseiscabiei TaxID=2993540 RepID=A0ABU4LF24_9ACTN|nr:transcriptional regulator [Streptomyces griseiscabiei]MBZ3902062.1 transcriptional regulator [Streptomyces griseiscabiei]MDX2914390.1 transcriptional regulator [Streptomyces griseiscabiei]